MNEINTDAYEIKALFFDNQFILLWASTEPEDVNKNDTKDKKKYNNKKLHYPMGKENFRATQLSCQYNCER